MHKVCPCGTASRKESQGGWGKIRSTEPVKKGSWGHQLSRGHLRGQLEAHMPLADILPLSFPAEASFEQMLRIKNIRIVRNTVWLVRHYPKFPCRMPSTVRIHWCQKHPSLSSLSTSVTPALAHSTKIINIL